MDTRLKSKSNGHGFGILAICMAVLLAAAATVGLYPYMERKALSYSIKRSQGQSEESRNDFGNIATQVMNFSYEIWHRQRQEEKGKVLTYAETFLPDLEQKMREAAGQSGAQNPAGGSPSSGPAGGAISGGGNEEAIGDAFSASEYGTAEDTFSVGEYGTDDAGDTDPDELTVTISGNGWTFSEDESRPYGTNEERLYYYQEMQDLINELGDSWARLYREYSPMMSYAVIGENGEYKNSNVVDPKSVFEAPLENNEILFTVGFSSTGQLSVETISTNSDEYGASMRTAMFQAMSRFSFYDPLAARLSIDYRNSGVEFQGPRNLRIMFRCIPQAMNGYDDSGAGSQSVLTERDYRRGQGYYMVVTAATLFIMAVALCLPFVKSFHIGEGVLCRLSFEPLSCIGACWLLAMWDASIPLSLISSTMNGTMQAEFMEAGFLDQFAWVLVLAVNVGFWAIIYGMFYWGITCYRAIFSLGPWRYFKERTWLGRFLRFIKRWVCRAINVFEETDWENNANRILLKAVAANFIILTLISCLWFWGIGALIIYSVVMFFLLKKYWGQLQEKYHVLLNAIGQVAEGDLNVEIERDLGVFNPFKEQLSRIQQGFRRAVEQEVKSERTKSELITNVSHDLKTPLTAIITYVKLLQQEGISEEERESYIRILDQKSMRLKVLIEDLFEISKATSGTVMLHLESVDIVSLLKQVRLELTERIEDSGIEFRLHLPEERVLLNLDSQKTYRIFENLMVNITKYGLPGTRAYIQVTREAGQVCITMRNISANELTVSPEELTERFTRADQSRNTEGSGLGLAIARSFVEAQGGTMKIELEEDIFRVIIRWKEGTPGPGPAEGRTEQEGIVTPDSNQNNN